MKLESLTPEIRQIRTNLTQIINEVTDEKCPLQIESTAGIMKEVGEIKGCLLRIEAINI